MKGVAIKGTEGCMSEILSKVIGLGDPKDSVDRFLSLRQDRMIQSQALSQCQSANDLSFHTL